MRVPTHPRLESCEDVWIQGMKHDHVAWEWTSHAVLECHCPRLSPQQLEAEARGRAQHARDYARQERRVSSCGARPCGNETRPIILTAHEDTWVRECECPRIRLRGGWSPSRARSCGFRSCGNELLGPAMLVTCGYSYVRECACPIITSY
jgi:hypothetical protein